MSLDNLGITFNDICQREDALKAIREAVDIYRSLTASYPDAFLPDLAKSLNNLGSTLSDLDQHEEALVTYNKALPIIRPLMQKYPQFFEEHLYRNLLGKKQVLRAMGREKEMPPEEMAKLEELRRDFSDG
jgi:tetratricopeptide (TPR) repeat protein